MHSQLAALIIACVIVLSSCAVRHRPVTNWKLQPSGQAHVLVPPKPPTGRAIELVNARSVRKGGPECGIDSRQVKLGWRGRTAKVVIEPGVVAPQGLVDPAGGPMRLSGTPVRDQSWWSEFLGELSKREAGRCLGAGEAELLSKRIIENVAMPSSQAFDLRYGNFPLTGYLDLEPSFALKYVSPILRPGVEKYSNLADVAGYETAYYHVDAQRGGGAKLRLRSVEHNIGRKTVSVAEPVTMRIALPESARFVRYFFREWRIAGDRKIALLATSRKDTLYSMTRRFTADPEGFCGSVSPSEAACVPIPRDTVLTPETAFRMNGKSVSVIIGGAIGDAARAAGLRKQEEILPNLKVSRPYEGMLLPVEFDRKQSSVLRLVLIGGEDVRW